MELSRIGGGVYRIPLEDGTHKIISGKLCHVYEIVESLDCSGVIEYLFEDGKKLFWKNVSVEQHQHYHGPQLLQLLEWFHQLGCPMSRPGYSRFAKITGVSAGRIQDAMRRVDTVSHKPLSNHAMLYIRYKIEEYLKLNKRSA